MTYSFQFRDVFAAWEFLLDGLILTLELSLVTMVVGLAIGMTGAAARVYGPVWLRRAVAVYVEAIRNTPFLVQVLFVYLGLPSIGLRLRPDQAALLAMVINLGAYSSEIVRAGIKAVPSGQLEAGTVRQLGPDLVFGRLWQVVGLPAILTDLLQERRFEFSVERAVYLTRHCVVPVPEPQRMLPSSKREQTRPDLQSLFVLHVSHSPPLLQPARGRMASAKSASCRRPSGA